MKVPVKWLIILFVLNASCNGVQINKAEECLVKFSNVTFTRSLNNAQSLVAINGNKLVLKSNAKSDNFNDPDGKLSNSTAPVLLTKVDNSKPFTFTAKVSPQFSDTYDAGTLYIYLNKNRWFKFAFEQDERKLTRAVTVRTIETSDDNNHDVVNSEGMYMKVSSDTKTVGFYYSIDKQSWQLVRLFKNDYPSDIWVGLSTQSPIGNGTTATFEEVSLNQTSVKDFRMGQ